MTTPPPPSQPPPPQANGAGPNPVKRTRQSKTKTRNGCKNCKLRRIKCDEKRPACTHCIKSRKECTGYPPPASCSRRLLLAPKPPGPALSTASGAAAAAASATTVAAAHTINPIRDPVFLPPRRWHRPSPATPHQSPYLVNAAAAAAHSPVLYQVPCTNLVLDVQEGQYFDLFRSCTARELSGYFDNVFWTRTVLQECHQSPAVKHAVVALGALYKTLDKWTESPPGSPSNPEQAPGSPRGREGAYPHYEVAVLQYSKACKAQMVRDGEDRGEKANRTNLMASVLLACFDSFIGDHKQAIKQIQNGLGLLEDLRAQRRLAMVSRPEEPVEDELLQMFTRLAIQAKSYDMAFHFPEPHVIHLVPKQPSASSPAASAGSPVSIHQKPIPERFSSLIEARVAWDALCEQCLRATEYMAQFANGPPNLLPQSMAVHGRLFAARIKSWSAAFDHILASRTAPGISAQVKAGIAVLKMFQIMGEILYLMIFIHSEMQFDAFRSHFQEIVDLASEVVGDEERRAAAKRCPDPMFCSHRVDGHGRPSTDIFGGHEYTANHIKPSFSADLGIVPPLYVVAAKSRDPVIRRQAIQLLRSSARREGMWDSQLTAQIGVWLMELEEGVDDDDAVHDEETDEFHLHHLPTPQASPVGQSTAVFSAGDGKQQQQSFGGEVPLGPGGNARWNSRLESISSAGSAPTATNLGIGLDQKPIVPAERRVLLRSAEFDLRRHCAVLKCGTRGLELGAPDVRQKETWISW